MLKNNGKYNRNTIRIFYLMIVCLFGILSLSMISASAIDIYVDDDGGKDYTTIQAAINAANPGDTIYVYNGTYIENIVVSKTLSIVGNNTNDCIVKPLDHSLPVLSIT